MYLAQNLKFLRHKSGLSQEEVARKLGKNYTIIGGYERGKVTPPIDVALNLCKLYDVDISVLIHVDLTQADANQEPWSAYKKPSDSTLMRLVERLEKQLHHLEEQVKTEDPDLAKRLGIL